MKESRGVNITPLLNHLFGDLIGNLQTKDDLKNLTKAMRELDKDPKFRFSELAKKMQEMQGKTPKE